MNFINLLSKSNKKSFRNDIFTTTVKRHISEATLFRVLTKARYLVLAGIGGSLYTLNSYVDDIKVKFGSLSDLFSIPQLKLKERKFESENTLNNNLSSNQNQTPISNSNAKNNTDKPPSPEEDIAKADEHPKINIEQLEKMTNSKEKKLQERLDSVLTDYMEMQKRFQKEFDRLENENKNLAKENLIMMKFLSNSDTDLSNIKSKFRHKTLIDQYATILDVLQSFSNNSFNFQDHLPRVVVIGDQSSGKTSVLELFAKARIFPRGSGSMMTRAPIMLTLGEGSEHIAYFNNDPNVIYDLTHPEQVNMLRNKILERMEKNVRIDNKTISSTPVSLTLKGPNISRMILVDLPGVINTVTTEMSSDTKDSIIDLAKRYMSNPNSIILCIQDGSVDAERSLVTDLTRDIDPEGRRTICVMTKIDIAEQNHVDKNRIEKLLSGQIFPMKALGYYAVIAGTGNNDDTISKINEYENSYFENSHYFKNGILHHSQASSTNLILQVRAKFWEMVHNSVRQSSDAVRSRLFSLETEWRHRFPNLNEMTRDELFEKSSSEILDDVSKLCGLFKSSEFENNLNKHLWNAIIPYVFKNIYLPNAVNGTSISFRTNIEVQLKQWIENDLTNLTVGVTKDLIVDVLSKIFDGRKEQTYYSAFYPMKETYLDCFKKEFKWGENNTNSLRLIQNFALSDTNLDSRLNWNTAAALADCVFAEELEKLEAEVKFFVGPSFIDRWLFWKSQTNEQRVYSSIRSTLMKYFNDHALSSEQPKPLPSDDIIQHAMANIPQGNGGNLAPNKETVIKIYSNLFLNRFLRKSIDNIAICRNGFATKDFSKNPLGCNELLLFWRIHRLIQQSSCIIQQQLASCEVKRIISFSKEMIDNSESSVQMKNSIQGSFVELANQIKELSTVKDLLDIFIESLQREIHK